MKTSLDLYKLAERKGVTILPFDLPVTGSLSVPGYIGIDEKACNTEAEKVVRLGHELEHCAHGWFYNRWAAYDDRRKMEYKAHKANICLLVPKRSLAAAVRRGITEPWELAEYFNVTEDFILEAMYYHKNGCLPG